MASFSNNTTSHNSSKPPLVGKRFFGLFKKNGPAPKEKKNLNTDNLISQVSNILQQQDISRPSADISHFLKLLDNDVIEASEYLHCLALAEVGILVDVSPSTQLKGVENSAGTSCYIDTILFAMYSQETAFDCLLHLRQLKTPKADQLQISCRFFVNLLRSNCLIRATTVERIREQLIACGWETTKNSQEDAVEFFLFLTGILELPFLPLNIKLFHGALEDEANDDKFTSDRVLALSLPNPASCPEQTLNGDSTDSQASVSSKSRVLHIEDLLLDYFCSNRIQGIRRKVNPTDNESSEKTAVTDAWSVLKLLPFYTSQNELGNTSDLRESDLSDPDLIFPLMIKRYSMNPDGSMSRDSRPIALSTEINFNNFVTKLDDAVADRSQNKYRLQLRAVVCHIGTSLQSGHYIVFVRDPNNNDWIQLDDMRSDKVRMLTSVKSATQAFKIMSQNSYLAFYKLKTGTSDTHLRSNTGITLDGKLAQKIQAQELLNNPEKTCKVQ